jgi:hypothetical protein
MPHTGNMPSNLSPSDEVLMRARLHVTGARTRLANGNTADALAAYYDAVLSAMLRFTISPNLSHKLLAYSDDDVADDQKLFRLLKKSGVLSAEISEEDFRLFHDVTYSAMDGANEEEHLEKVTTIVCSILGELGVLDNELVD